MRNTINTLFLIFYSTLALADYLPYLSAQKLYDLSNIVFIGSLVRIEEDNLNYQKYAFLKNMLSIKGDGGEEIRLCNKDIQSGLTMWPIGNDKQVYFVKKQNDCYVGVLGSRSIIPIKKGTNCIFAEFAYPHEESAGKLEPLEVFVNKLVGGGIVSFPKSLKAEKCEPLFQGSPQAALSSTRIELK